MAITDAQKVDLLYKKLGFGVAKTDTSAFKSPSNEANASPLLTRGDTIWQLSDQIPAVIPVANTSVISLYTDATTSAVRAVLDATVSGTNRTWLTNVQDWIPPEFGSSYQVKIYADTSGSTTPQTTGTQLFADGSGNNDSWYFDYQAGILNFADTNVPSALTGKVIFVVGARYSGTKGLGTLGNVTSNNIIANNFSSGNTVITGGYITGLANITANTGNVIYWYANTVNATTANLSNAVITTANIGNLNFADTTISSLTGNVSIQPLLSNPNAVVIINSKSALQLPSGSTAEEPTVVANGSIRWNSTNSRVEYYSGTAWAAITGQIDNQVIIPDGVNSIYTLDYVSTSEGIIVSINGTLQQPDVAYTVAGTTITFAEIPLTTDVISVRFISSGVASWTGGEVTGAVHITDTTTSTSITTGALIVDGGTGIASNINIGGNATISSLAGVGSRTVTASATGLLSAASDSSLKTEITTVPIPGLAEVLQIQPKAYKWNSDIALRGTDAAIEIGFFADQVAPIIPSAAPKGVDNLYGFYDRSVLAALVKAVQEQQVTINELQQKIANLQANQK